jgi:hypothetical protein
MQWPALVIQRFGKLYHCREAGLAIAVGPPVPRLYEEEVCTLLQL